MTALPPPDDRLSERPLQAADVRHSADASQTGWDRLRRGDISIVRIILQQEASPWRGIEQVPTKDLAISILDALQSELDQISPEDYDYRKICIKCIRALSKRYDVLPSQLYIPRSSLSEHDNFRTGGSFSDICRGKIIGRPDPVCLKRLRIFEGGWLQREKVKRAFCQEALIWRQLRHKNILPFYGVSEDIFASGLCLISPWMENGNIHDFLQTHPMHERHGWVCDVAAGMQYLHNLDPCIIHKDIRGANILVGSDCRCRLTDFGISLIAETQMPGSTTRGRGNVRWLPPEMINASDFDAGLLQQVDIYSFGCTIIEMYTGKPPYAELTDGAVIVRIMQRKAPSKPPSDVLPSALWTTVVTKCLSPFPQDRPSADAILDTLRKMDGSYPKPTRGKQAADNIPGPQPSAKSSPIDQDWARIDLGDVLAIKKVMIRDIPWRGIESVPVHAAAAVMDRLQSEVDEVSVDDLELRKKYVKCLHRLSKQYDILPTQLYIPKAALQSREGEYSRGGSFSDVYQGKIHGHPEPVCLKRLRIWVQGGKRLKPEDLIKALCKEALSWRQVSHENILPFYGVSNDMFNGLCLISPWMENGTILDFLAQHPDHDRRGWVRDVSAGLNYLHQLDPCIVHKDIRGGNLLVGADHRCFIADFGISIMNETLKPGTNTRGAGSTHWLPPEVLTNSRPLDNSFMQAVDIYSFGCTIVEMFTGHPPYWYLRTESAVVEEILKMSRPPRPSPDLLPPELWNAIVEPALSPAPESRPSAAKIMADLKILYPAYIAQYLDTRSRCKPLKRILEWVVPR